MKKFLSLLIIFGMVFMGIGGFGTAQAVSTNTFIITVSVNYIEMNLQEHTSTSGYTTWNIGSLVPGGSDTMTQAEGVVVDLGTTSQTVDIESHVSNNVLAWTLVTTVPSANEYRITAQGYPVSQNPVPDFSTTGTVLTTSTADVVGATAVAGGADTWLYYKFDAPSSVDTGAEQTITITVSVTASSI